MIAHILKIVWNRRKINYLIWLEMVLGFGLLLTVITFSTYYYKNATEPIGFDYENTYMVYVSRMDLEQSNSNISRAGTGLMQVHQRTEQIIQQLKNLKGIVSVGQGSNLPYDENSMSTGYQVNGKKIRSSIVHSDIEFAEAMKLKLIDGRWFTEQDYFIKEKPIVINKMLADEYFQHKPILGQLFQLSDSSFRTVIGVAESFKKSELDPLKSTYFSLFNPSDSLAWPLSNLIIRTENAMSVEQEEQIIRLLNQLAPSWSFNFKSLELERKKWINERITPVIIFSIIVGFLLFLAALGLVGVLWQSNLTRFREFGIRRAKGATGLNIHQQILGETIGLALIAIIPGTVIYFQLPFLNILPAISVHVMSLSWVLSSGLMIGLVTLAAWVPGRMASKMTPMEALRSE